MGIKERVNNCLRDVGTVDLGEIDESLTLEEMGLDSLDNVDLFFKIEKEFNIYVDDEDMGLLYRGTVNDLYSFIENVVFG